MTEEKLHTEYSLIVRTAAEVLEQLRDGTLVKAPFARVGRWNAMQRSRFVETLATGYPSPQITVAHDNDRMVVIDGWQRLSALADFAANRFPLTDLSPDSRLEQTYFDHLIEPDRASLLAARLTFMELGGPLSLQWMTQVFRRFNETASMLSDAELRDIGLDGSFYRFARTCANSPLLRKLVERRTRTPESERLELVLRFFAFSDRYQSFVHEVARFIDDYISDMNRSFNEERLRREFDSTLEYVARVFPTGFRRSDSTDERLSRSRSEDRVPRVRFEAIAVGTNLALRTGRAKAHPDMSWIQSEEFRNLVRPEASNSRVKLEKRIEFVRDRLLE